MYSAKGKTVVWLMANVFMGTLLFVAGIFSAGAYAESRSTREEIEQLLREADVYFRAGALTAPEGANAYELYQRVLELDIANRHAINKTYEIALITKSKMDEANHTGDKDAVEAYYQKYRDIAGYLLRDVVGIRLEQALQQYKDLKQQEHDGEGVHKDLAHVLQDIVELLEDIKKIYALFPAESIQTEIDRIDEEIVYYRDERSRYVQ